MDFLEESQRDTTSQESLLHDREENVPSADGYYDIK